MKHQSIAKTYASPHPLPNEDACWHPSPQQAALSDGAGGTGIACHHWAAALVQNLPQEPIRHLEDLVSWLRPLAISFFEQQEKDLSLHQIGKLYQEGSSATLAAVWKVNTRWHFFGYGDSHWFVFSPQHQLLLSAPYHSAEQFLGSTYLLNPITQPSPEAICTESWEAEVGNVYFLASDEIAKHILGTLSKKTEQLASFIAAVQGSESDFIQYLENQSDIGSDDYSVIYWEDTPENLQTNETTPKKL